MLESSKCETQLVVFIFNPPKIYTLQHSTLAAGPICRGCNSKVEEMSECSAFPDDI